MTFLLKNDDFTDAAPGGSDPGGAGSGFGRAREIEGTKTAAGGAADGGWGRGEPTGE